MLWRGKEKITILSFDYCILTGSIPYLAAYCCQPKSGITIYKCKWSVTLSTLNKTVRFFPRHVGEEEETAGYWS